MRDGEDEFGEMLGSDRGEASEPNNGDEEFEFPRERPDGRTVRVMSEESLEEALQKLREHARSAEPPPSRKTRVQQARWRWGRWRAGPGGGVFDTCSPSSGAHDVIKFHQRMVALLIAEVESRPEHQITLACATADLVRLSLGFLQRYEQTWEYLRTVVGRPVSYISLAPLERGGCRSHRNARQISRARIEQAIKPPDI